MERWKSCRSPALGVLSLFEVANVFVVEVHVDERAQLAIFGEQVLAQLGIPVDRLPSASPTVPAGSSTLACLPAYWRKRVGIITFISLLLMQRGGPAVSWRPLRHDCSTADFLVVKLLAFFSAASSKELVCVGRACSHAGDDVGAADPVGLGEIGRRPASGMVRMRVVEADDVQLALARASRWMRTSSRGSMW